MRIIETIPDLRRDQRARPFWLNCTALVECAEIVSEMPKKPCRKYDFNVELLEAIRLWKWCVRFRTEEFNPPKGEEILVNVATWRPISGTHRASALYVLGKAVPALLVEIPKTRRYELVFEGGVWLWRK